MITDAWNMKPLLAEAMRGYPIFLLYQAPGEPLPAQQPPAAGRGAGPGRGSARGTSLPRPRFATAASPSAGIIPGRCTRRAALAGVGTAEYDRKLRRSLQEAEAVLVLNPHDGGDAGAVSPEPCSGRPLGPRPGAVSLAAARRAERTVAGQVATLFMAAVAGEFIKGFHVAHEACRLLRQTRSDFELVVTFNPPGPGRIDEFTRSVGWCSQDELPRHYRAADICLVPTIAQDGLSITSVEAMASGIPVVASRIGGVPYTVSDGLTGLLFEPGDPADLARQIARLLDDPDLRRRMGLAGPGRFEEEFTWETVIERHWRPLLDCRALRMNSA